MQRNPHSYQIATGYRTFYSLSLIYQPITKKRLFFCKKTGIISVRITPVFLFMIDNHVAEIVRETIYLTFFLL